MKQSSQALMTIALITAFNGCSKESFESCRSLLDCRLSCPQGAEMVLEASQRFCVRKDGKKDGPFREWRGERVVSQGQYRNGAKTGKWLEIEGPKILEGHYHKGKRTGLWTSRMTNGSRGELEYENGVQHGRLEVWYSSGRKSAQGTFRNGKEHGLWTSWHENGRIWKKAEFDEGKPSGEWIVWDEEGTQVFSRKF